MSGENDPECNKTAPQTRTDSHGETVRRTPPEAMAAQDLQETTRRIGIAETQPLMHFSDIDLPEFLIRRADKTALRLVPEWTSHLTPADGPQSGELSRTIRAFADCSLNVKQTARRLGVHTNTVYFRLNRINKLTGIDARTFSGASLLLTALRLLETHANGK